MNSLSPRHSINSICVLKGQDVNLHAKVGLINECINRCKTRPKYVRLCKSLDAKQCEQNDCCRKAQFGVRVEGVVRWCKLHKIKGTINLCVKRCDVNGCNKFPSWGYKGHKVTRCRAHAESEMSDRKKRCAECDKIATWGFVGGVPEWCRAHCKEGTQNIVTRRCNVMGCKKFSVKREGVCREHSF